MNEAKAVIGKSKSSYIGNFFPRIENQSVSG